MDGIQEKESKRIEAAEAGAAATKNKFTPTLKLQMQNTKKMEINLNCIMYIW